MSLGSEVARAIHRTGTKRSPFSVFECVGCGRAFARDHERCPTCGGIIKEVVLR